MNERPAIRPPSKMFSGTRILLLVLALVCAGISTGMAAEALSLDHPFPRPLDSYPQPEPASLWHVLKGRVEAEPFNAVATILFFLAILHTFMAPYFLRLSHRFEEEHRQKLARAGKAGSDEVSFKAELFHFLGEVEAVFGIWVVPLLIAITLYKGWGVGRNYIGHVCNFTEPLFVVVIMTIAASQPILKFAEKLMAVPARLGGGTPGAWWISILTVGPLLGSFVTEPGAMTICALLLCEKFYRFKPSAKFAYATLGLLFVDISVGGVLTHFAAPPVLMVAGKWGWGMSHMLTHFGWKAIIGIAAANVIYFFAFRGEFKALASRHENETKRAERAAEARHPIPVWIVAVHVLFMAWTVLNNHVPALFGGAFLFYLAFVQATEHHQGDLQLRPALLVGFFLAGLVVHGGLQGWWIQPVLASLTEVPLFLGAAFLTSFNDNAAITYLASLVPDFSDALKYAVMSGAVVGGGLTVIANAPNPAGQSILSKFFPDGVSPLKLFLGAAIPTVIVGAAFLLLR